MLKENRLYGLMAGIAVGFAVWGSVRAVPEPACSTYGNTYIEERRISGIEERRITGAGENTAGANAAEVNETGANAAEVNETGANAAGERTSGVLPAAAAGEKGSEEEQPKLHALCAVLMDGDSGRILFEKEGDTFRPMASTTKIMTCILALENGSLSDVCTVSANAAAQPKVHLGAGTGTKFYLKDLLYSLMLESHNDTAVVIAEQIGGSVEGFAELMNQKARDLGCMDTCFITPNGLDAVITEQDGTKRMHGTTAADLARIMRYCLQESPKREEFLEITRTSNYSFMDTERKQSFSCVNHNALLTMLEGALSGKTGFTGGAGYSYVGAYESDGRKFIAALLGCGWPPHKTWKWADARALFQYGRENFHYRDVYQEPQLEAIPVSDGVEEGKDREKHEVALTMNLPEEECHLQLLLREDEQVSCRMELPARLKAPVTRGELLGHYTFFLNGEPVRSYPVYAAESVRRRDFPYCLRRIWKQWLISTENVN